MTVLRWLRVALIAAASFSLAFVVVASFWYEREGRLDAWTITILALIPAAVVTAVVLYADRRRK